MRLVVDASVAAKWYFAEPGHEAADRVLASRVNAERELLAPDLIVAEFTNVLWRRVRRRECTFAAAEQILELWEVDRPELVPCSDLAQRAFQLASSLDQSVYDCLYLALAVEIDAPLVTADRALARAARSLGAPVELIA